MWSKLYLPVLPLRVGLFALIKLIPLLFWQSLPPPAHHVEVVKCRMIFKVDKGVAMVVLDKKEYLHKAQHLLEQPTYQTIPSDPANKYKPN